MFFSTRFSEFLLVCASPVQTTVSTEFSTNGVLVQHLLAAFIPLTCQNSIVFGPSCNLSNAACTTLQPCQNNGTCIDNNTQAHGYSCSCPPGFAGSGCHLDQRPSHPPIAVMECAITFIVTMDVLKYGFGVDPIDRRAQKSKKAKQKKQPSPLIVRFLYVNQPAVE